MSALDRIDFEALGRELVAFRRDFHKYAESAWTEYRTTARIIAELEKLGLPVKFGAEIHTPEKMFGLPKPAVMEACYQRALAETDRPDLVEQMKGGFTGCITEIVGAKPGPTVGVRVDIDCNDLEEASVPEHVPAAEGFRSVHPGCMHGCGHDCAEEYRRKDISRHFCEDFFKQSSGCFFQTAAERVHTEHEESKSSDSD